MPATVRILDANLNRAREALRVMEEAARLALEDTALSSELKNVRHELSRALEGLRPGWLAANRDVEGDVGTSITTGDEATRAGLVDVVAAAGRRLGEALRVIEEASKTLDAAVARQVESIRYRGYEIESALLARLGSGRGRQWRVCVLLTESLCARPWTEVLQGAIDGGADCIQVREPDLGGAALARRVEDVVRVARPASVSVVVNDRVDVAWAAGADGVHLGQGDLPVRAARRLVGRGLLVGVSTRSLDEAEAASIAGADYCGVGPMFKTKTKAVAEPVGPAYLEAFLERFPATPHLAIGGIGPRNIGRLLERGVQGVAVCSAVCSAPRPDEVVKTLRAAMEEAPAPH